MSEIFSNWSAVVSAVCAFLALVGTGFSWWRSNLSAKSRQEAKLDRERAEKAAVDASQQRAAIERLADSIEKWREEFAPSLEGILTQSDNNQAKRDIEAVWKSRNVFVLRNNRPTPFSCEYVRNRDLFPYLRIAQKFTLNPGEGIEVRAGDTHDRGMPTELILGEVGMDSPLYVPLDGRLSE